ncbi:MAG TPA: hypothetical protein PKD26_06780 [Pyrinomonadaceae bacterium]|nr:hypothetical protein [Pyrinomonadaceae bacterium]
MSCKLFPSIRNGIGVLAITAAVALGLVTAQEASGQKRTLEGVWRVRIVPRNCTTGVPIPGAESQALYTFHMDGTMSAWTQNSTITTTRSPSHGLWKREHGWSDYSFKFLHLRYSGSTGMFLGKQEGSGALVLSENGEEFTADGSATVFDVNDTPGTPGCSNSFGTRFNLD